MSYFPVTPNRSGEILAAGQMQAANTQAQMMGQLGQDIGGALASIGNIYGEIEGMKAKGRAFKKTMEVVGPSFGMTTDKLAAIAGTDLKNDMDWARFGETMTPMLPSLINATLAQGRLGVQQNAPFVDQYLNTQRDIAGGNRTFTPTGGGGMPAPVEPPMTMDGAEPGDAAGDASYSRLPAAASPTPMPSMPGGQASIDKINRDRARRGLEPIR